MASKRAEPTPEPGRSALVHFPNADYTHSAALRAARKVFRPPHWRVVDGAGSPGEAGEVGEASSSTIPHTLYFADYDLLPFEDLAPSSSSSSSSGFVSQCSSYVIRKALIRKHFLAGALHSYATKYSHTELGQRTSRLAPRTWALELQFADELDELLLDDLWDLKEALDRNEMENGGTQGDVRWFILKPGMADRGNGIRMFSTLEQLCEIFEEFEDEEEDEEEESKQNDTGGGKDTAVMTSQLRHFVIQEYVSDPLLVTPSSQSATAQSTSETLSSLSLNENPSTTDGPRKFHLRAYVLCVGGLRVYLYDEMLALFAPLAYEAPRLHDDQDASEGAAQNGNTGGPDLRRHLTNTCLQEDGSLGSGRPSEQNVYLWSDLAGSSASQSGRNNPMSNLSEEDVTNVKKMAAQVIGDAFGAAARAGSVHWQMWPNCWEIFGVDLLVGWDEKKGDADIKTDSGTDAGRKEHGGKSLRVWLLEINAQPDFAQTGARLSGTIDRLFQRVLECAVLPFHAGSEQDTSKEEWVVGESRGDMTLCFDEEMSRAW